MSEDWLKPKNYPTFAPKNPIFTHRHTHTQTHTIRGVSEKKNILVIWDALSFVYSNPSYSVEFLLYFQIIVILWDSKLLTRRCRFGEVIHLQAESISYCELRTAGEVHPRKITWQWQNNFFSRRYIFIHGCFSSVMLVFEGCNFNSWLCFTELPSRKRRIFFINIHHFSWKTPLP